MYLLVFFMSEKGGNHKFSYIAGIALAILGLVKESYKISMKRSQDEFSLDYENEIEKMLSMLDVDSIRESLESKGKSPVK